MPGMVSGQAFTEEYTTVLEALYTLPDSTYISIFCVYFGNTCAYTVKDPPDVFFDDLAREKMLGRGQKPDKVYGASFVKVYGALRS